MMRKLTAWLLILVLVVSLGCAGADGTGLYLMAGYDSTDSGHDWETNAFFTRMAEVTGLSFAFEQYKDQSTWHTALETLLDGSDNMPDVLFKAQLTTNETMKYLASGALIDLKPYLEEYAPNLWALLQSNPEWMAAVTLPGGEIVALPTINELPTNNLAWINTTWLKNVGMEKPTTIDELTEVLRAFKEKDPNQNGHSDEIPLVFTSLWDLRFLAQGFGLIANDYFVRVTDGQVVCVADTQANRSFLEWLHTLWTEKLIDVNGFSSNDTLRAVTDDDATITYGIVFGTTAMNLLPVSVSAQYDAMMPLTVDGQPGKWRALQSEIVRGTFAITSHCKNPGEVLKWVDYLYTHDGERLAQAGKEEEEYFFNEDGTWEYTSGSEDFERIMSSQVIMGGGDMPGWFSAEFQLQFNDTNTHRAVEQMYQVKQVSEYPFPLVYLTAEEQDRINTLWAELGPDLELKMVHFVTGDEPLTDESWTAFVERIHTGGMDEMLTIWQKSIER